MLSITHIVVSLLLIQILTLDRNDAFVALLFGVFIDLDHLFGLREYTHANGFGSLFDFQNLMNPGGHWKSMLHSPVAVAVVGPLSIASRLAIPLLFWGVHVAMDFAEEAFLGNFSQVEAMILLFAGLSLVTLRFSSFLETHHHATILQYLKNELLEVRRSISSRPSSLSV